MPDPSPASVPVAHQTADDLDRVAEIITRLLALGVSDAAVEPVCDWLRDRRNGKPERAWFFGCWHGAGHFLRTPNGRSVGRDDPLANGYGIGPFGRIDGYLTPTETTKQSAASLHHKDGWTALSMHDYSEDKRPGCNANFIFDADLSWDRALIEARERFPMVVGRIEAAAPITGPHECDERRKRRG